MPTADELWARVQAAEKEHQAAQDKVEAFGVIDLGAEWVPMAYHEAYDAAGRAWVKAEVARHELDAFLNPKRYAKKGYGAGPTTNYAPGPTPNLRQKPAQLSSPGMSRRETLAASAERAGQLRQRVYASPPRWLAGG